jgi:branched-subunit amino acid aminotransferase/4-amino-4-deoxychorismate lyase
MQAGKFLLLDGKLVESNICVLHPDNRSFRYGDGFFETIKWEEGGALLWNYHITRFFDSLNQLLFNMPKHWNEGFLKDAISLLIKKNKHTSSARVRCTVFRGEGGLYDVNNGQPHLLVQSWSLVNQGYLLNQNGLDICVYRDSIKVADKFSALKVNSSLPYVLAAFYAKKNRCNDAVLLNQWERVTDSSIANIFYIDKKNIIYTPPLSEGCISGVMRKFLIDKMSKIGLSVHEKPFTVAEIHAATGVFLTNAIRGVQWVKSCDTSIYSAGIIPEITKSLFL